MGARGAGWIARLKGSLAAAIVRRFVELELLAHAAALAFYTLISLAPMLVLLLWVTASFPGATQGAIVDQLASLVGRDAAQVAGTVIEHADREPSMGSLAGWWSTALLVVGATAVFARLQDTLNRIFRTDARHLPGVLGWLRKRVLSFGVVLALGFLFLLATTVNTLLQVALADLPTLVPVLGTLASSVLYALTFGLMFHTLPDRDVPWRVSIAGGVLTTCLFMIGRWAIGLYLATAAPGSAYGSMGALVLLLVWIYYGALMFFGGALVTAMVDERATARRVAS